MKGIFGLVKKFGEQFTKQEAKALSKLGTLKKHRDLVPLHHKTPAAVNRQGAVYRANKDVKSLFDKRGTNLPPALSGKKDPRSVVTMQKGTGFSGQPGHEKIPDYKKPQYAGSDPSKLKKPPSVDDILSSMAGKRIPPAKAHTHASASIKQLNDKSRQEWAGARANEAAWVDRTRAELSRLSPSALRKRLDELNASPLQGVVGHERKLVQEALAKSKGQSKAAPYTRAPPSTKDPK